MNNNEPFIWDKYSDQPYPIKNKAYKKQKRKENLFDYIPLLLSNALYFPLGVINSYFSKSKKDEFPHFFGMCVNKNKGIQQVELINELDLDEIQIRIPLAKIEKIDEYLDFAKKFENKRILINIMQDRAHIEDKEKLKESITLIFEKFKDISSLYQIANAINRTKWGFFSIKEYLEFYKVVYDLRNEKYPHIKLVGPSIIDFEYHYTIRALFNFFKIKFDKNASLLYVDRRGAPENTQMGIFDTSKKIDFLYSLCNLSSKTSNEILVSESNWPISNTAPWAPTSEKECVDEDSYTNYMLRYYFLCLASKKIQTVYWHQLIAPGYGLIDTRDGFRKREAFEAFKFMVKTLKNSKVLTLEKKDDIYTLKCLVKEKSLSIIWSIKNKDVKITHFNKAYDKFGKVIKEAKVGQSPIYVYYK